MRARCSTTTVGGVAHGAGGGDGALEAAAGRGGGGEQPAAGALGLGRPGDAGAAEQPALAEVDLGGAQHGQLLGPLDALGDHARAHLAGERHGGAQDGLARVVEVDAGDHAAAELEEVGADLGDVLERREAGAGVVDGDQGAAGDPRAQPLLDAPDVLHGVLLGELDDQARGQALGELGQAGVPERVGGDVDEQQAPVRRLAGAGHGGPAGDLEVVAQAAAGGRGERDVGRQGDQAGRRREAGEALVADRLEVAEADDRLEDGTDRAGLEQPAEVGRPIGARARERMRLPH